MDRALTALCSFLFALSLSGADAATPLNVKVGAFTDTSGPFANQAGIGSELAARMTAEDFAREAPDIKVEIVLGDHQNKPDVGSAIVRRWVDEDKVAAVVDVPKSGVALPINDFLAERHRTFLASGVATSDFSVL